MGWIDGGIACDGAWLVGLAELSKGEEEEAISKQEVQQEEAKQEEVQQQEEAKQASDENEEESLVDEEDIFDSAPIAATMGLKVLYFVVKLVKRQFEDATTVLKGEARGSGAMAKNEQWRVLEDSVGFLREILYPSFPAS